MTPFPPRVVARLRANRGWGGRTLYEVDAESGCWLWCGSLVSQGYGVIQWREDGLRRAYRAHGAMYEVVIGPVPAGLVLDHLCRVRGCVNPAHLEPVTQQQNSLRGIGWPAINAAKTHCVNGHEFSPDNLYHHAPYRRGRRCRTCTMESNRRAYHRRRAA